MDVGQPLSLRHWDHLLACCLLAVVLPTIGISHFQRQIQRAHIAGALGQLANGRIQVQEEFAFTGRWQPSSDAATTLAKPAESKPPDSKPPDSSPPDSRPPDSKPTDSTLAIRHGALDAHFSPGSKLGSVTLSLRAGTLPVAIPATLLWQCGQGQFPAGVQALAASHTTLETDLLPLSCRRQYDANAEQ